MPNEGDTKKNYCPKCKKETKHTYKIGFDWKNKKIIDLWVCNKCQNEIQKQ